MLFASVHVHKSHSMNGWQQRETVHSHGTSHKCISEICHVSLILMISSLVPQESYILWLSMNSILISNKYKKQRKLILVHTRVGSLVNNYLIHVQYLWQLFFKQKISVTTVNNNTALSIRVLWDVTLCGSVSGSWHFKQMWYLPVQESNILRSLKMKAPHSFKISRPHTEWRSITFIFLATTM